MSSFPHGFRNAAGLGIALAILAAALPAGAEARAPARAVVRVCAWSGSQDLIGSAIRFTVDGKPTFTVLGPTVQTAGCSAPLKLPVGKTVTIAEQVPTSVDIYGVKPMGAARIGRIKGATVTITVRPDDGGKKPNVVVFENEAA